MTLRSLTWAGVILPSIGLSLALFVLPQLRPQIPVALFAITFSAGSLLLAHRGRLRVATWTFVLGFMVLMLTTLLGTGLGVQSTAFDLGILASVLTGLLLGWRAALVIAVIHIALLCGTYVAERFDHLPPPIFPPTTVWFWVSRLLIDAWILVGLGLGLRRMEATRARLERRVAERTEQLGTARDRALAASQTKSDFLANMSHEIRTPMNAVIGMTGLLLETELSERQRGFTEVVRGSGEALLELINDVLDFSKIEAGELVIERVPTDVRECVENAAHLLAPAAEHNGLELFAHVGDDVPVAIHGDPTRLQQVLVNLVSNAIKFTDTGSVEVLLSLATGAADPSGDRVTVRMAVRDTGSGMSVSEISRVFDEFVQADASTTRHFGGTGLGLTIARHLCELMDGAIEVESEEDRGSTFSAQMTFSTASAVQTDLDQNAASPQPGDPSPLRGLHVLIADDNPINRMVLTRMIESLGGRAEQVSGGMAAIESVRLNHHGCILMDCKMSGMDGMQATTAIRSLDVEHASTVPIIAVTGSAMPHKRADILASGMNDVLLKPIARKDLLSMLLPFVTPS